MGGCAWVLLNYEIYCKVMRNCKLFLSRPLSPTMKSQIPISRIPIRTANAEKRARDLGLLQDIDETKLSPSELRALR